MSNSVELSDDGKVAIEMLRYHRAKIAEHKEAEAQAGRMKQPLRAWVLWPR